MSFTQWVAALDAPEFAWFARAMQDYYYPVLFLLAALAWVTLEKRHVVIVAVLVALFAVHAAKAVYAEPRPCVYADGLLACPDSDGFPSGHAASSFAFAAGALGTSVFWFFLSFAVLVSLSRVTGGVHTVEQVAAGAAVGVAAFFVTDLAFRWARSWWAAARKTIPVKKRGRKR